MIDLAGIMTDLGLPLRGLVHVGAHAGQEVPVYRAAGYRPIVLVEPNPLMAAHLRREYPEERVVQAAAGTERGRIQLHVTEDSQMSSVYPPLRMQAELMTVPALPLREIIGPDVTVAVVDVQGAELDVVAGAPLDTLLVLVLETRTRARYRWAPLHDQVIDHMADLGWRAVRSHPHGDPRRARVFDTVFIPEISEVPRL